MKLKDLTVGTSYAVGYENNPSERVYVGVRLVVKRGYSWREETATFTEEEWAALEGTERTRWSLKPGSKQACFEVPEGQYRAGERDCVLPNKVWTTWEEHERRKALRQGAARAQADATARNNELIQAAVALARSLAPEGFTGHVASEPIREGGRAAQVDAVLLNGWLNELVAYRAQAR